MSWLPAIMWMHMLDDDELEKQSSTGCNAGNTPVVDEINPSVTDDTPVNNSATNNAEDAPSRTWHHHVMSSDTFALSSLLAYIAT